MELDGVLVQAPERIAKSKRIIKKAERSQTKMHFDYLRSLLGGTQATLAFVLMVPQTQLHIRDAAALRKGPGAMSGGVTLRSR